MTPRIADRASGALQSVADAAQGVKHEIRARGSEHQPSSDRTAAAQARWQAGLPARNTYERDAYAVFEANNAAGLARLDPSAREGLIREHAERGRAQIRSLELEHGAETGTARVGRVAERGDFEAGS